MVVNILLAALGLVWILSCAEIIGSWLLTYWKQDLKWPLSFTILPIVIMPLSVIAAYDSIYYAGILYDSGRSTCNCHWQESLYQWLRHGCLSIDEWAAREANGKGK